MISKPFSLVFLSAIYLIGCFSNNTDTAPEIRRAEIISLANQNDIDGVAREMKKKNWVETQEGNDIFYSESEREKDDEQDYCKFNLHNSSKFLLALFEEDTLFIKAIDSCQINDNSIRGCKKGSKYYRLSPNCFVCNEGYSRNLKRFVIKVSRTGKFEETAIKGEQAVKGSQQSKWERQREIDSIYRSIIKKSQGHKDLKDILKEGTKRQ